MQKTTQIAIPDECCTDSSYSNGKPTIDQQYKDPAKLHILGFDFSTLSQTHQFLVVCTGVFFFFLLYGYFQELIFSLEGFKPFGWYITLVQFAFYTCFGVIETSRTAFKRSVPIQTYALLAFLTVATMGLSNTSLGYLNYPTQVIFKCCKLIPVLIGGILIQGKVFAMLDWFACICMSIGLIFFTLADSTVQPSFSMYGILLISLALCADAAIGNVQEKVMKQYHPTNAEIVLYSYGIGFLYILVGQVVSGQIITAFLFCVEYPVRTYGYIFVFSLTGYCGVSLVLTLVKSTGALTAVTITTCRKSVTMVLSFLLFSKPFTYQYLWSGLIVIFGIYLNIYSKNRGKMDNINSKILKLCVKKVAAHRDTIQTIV